MASQIGVAPRRPAQPSISRSRTLSGASAVATKVGDRPGDEDQHRRERQPLQRHVAELAGEDQQAEQDEEGDLGDPAEPLVEGDDGAPRRDAGAAERQRRQVDGEQAGAVGDLGERRRRAPAIAIVATG